MTEKSKELYDKLVGDPERLLGMYSHYSDLLTREDAMQWWAGEFAIADAERNKLKENIDKFIEWLNEKRPYVPGLGAPIMMLKSIKNGEDPLP